MKKIDIIITTFNEEMVIERKLRNCFNLDYPKEKYNVIVVDDFSTDDTVAIVKKFKNVCLLKNKYNKGKCGAMRTGFENTSSELVAITDADILLKNDAIKIAIPYLKNKNIGAVCGMQKLLMGKDKPSFFEDIYREIYTKIRLIESKIDSAPIMHGQFMIIKRSNLVCVNEETYADDTDMAIKIRKKGYKTKYIKECIFYEESPKSFKELYDQKIRRGTGLIQVFWRHKNVLFNPKYGLFGLVIFPFEFSLYLLQPLLSFIFFIAIFFVLLLINKMYSLIYAILIFLILQIPSVKTYMVMNKALLKGLYNFVILKPTSSWDKERD